MIAEHSSLMRVAGPEDIMRNSDLALFAIVVFGAIFVIGSMIWRAGIILGWW